MDALKIAEIHGMLDTREVVLIKKYASALPAQAVAVNIGSGAGTSTVAIMESKQDLFLFEVDIIVQNLARRMRDESGITDQHRFALILGKSWNIGANWPIPIDLLFVDGSHTEEDVRRDISAWVPKVKDGGIVMFHDYRHPKAPEVTPVVDEMMRGHELLETARYLAVFRISPSD